MMTPSQSAARAREIVETMTGDAKHRSFDQLVNEIACQHGHHEAVAVFEKHAAPHHQGGNCDMKTIYLCGPINGCTDHEAKDWRESVKAQWQGVCIDPMRRDYRGEEAAAFRDIVELDKIDVAQSDVLLVNYDKPSVGTSMEILFAWQIGKMVVTVANPDAVISPWLRYHSHYIAPTFAAALAFIAAGEAA